MIRTYKSQGIILSRRNIGEADKILTIFTREFGKRTFLAKGIRRVKSRRAAHLEVFNHVSFLSYPGKSLDVITEVSTVTAFPLLRTRLERIAYSYIVLELTDRMTAENQESHVLFHYLLNLLSQLNNQHTSREMANELLFSYKKMLLTEQGFIERASSLSTELIEETIEYVLERKLTSPLFLTNIQQHLYRSSLNLQYFL